LIWSAVRIRRASPRFSSRAPPGLRRLRRVDGLGSECGELDGNGQVHEFEAPDGEPDLFRHLARQVVLDDPLGVEGHLPPFQIRHPSSTCRRLGQWSQGANPTARSMRPTLPLAAPQEARAPFPPSAAPHGNLISARPPSTDGAGVSKRVGLWQHPFDKSPTIVSLDFLLSGP